MLFFTAVGAALACASDHFNHWIYVLVADYNHPLKRVGEMQGYGSHKNQIAILSPSEENKSKLN